MPTLTPLSTLISRMQRYQAASKTEEQYLVRDLDEAIASLRQELLLPWAMKKGTIRVFKDVFLYPLASDHDELSFIDTQKENAGFMERPKYRYTSFQEFLEDVDNRNDIAEVWDQGTRLLALRYHPAFLSAVQLDSAEDTTRYAASGDASGITLDEVVYSEGNGSIRFTNTVSSGTATVRVTLQSAVSDTNYKRKYLFVKVYLSGAPTSVTIKFLKDNGNYLQASITKQFSGQDLVANDWNLLAIDLNAATATGTIDGEFNYVDVSLVGAPAGTYNIDASYLREWELQDYWYYSSYSVATVGQVAANQEFFFNSSEVYSTDSQLNGDKEWSWVIVYDALLTTVGDTENDKVAQLISAKRARAWNKLMEKYPDSSPIIITHKWRFANQLN